MCTIEDATRCNRQKFEVAIICALKIESTGVEACLDEVYDASVYGKATGDRNSYTMGRMGRHYIVLTYLPSMGKVSSASAASGLVASFTGLRLTLLVGICGAVPFKREEQAQNEIFLGDIIISTGVVQYDLGKQYDGGRPVRKKSVHDNLSRLPLELRAFLHKCQAGLESRKIQAEVHRYIQDICSKEDFAYWSRPAIEQDVLYSSDYIHKHRQPDICADCQAAPDRSCPRAREATCKELKCGDRVTGSRHIRQHMTSRPSNVRVHWGLIASGDLVVKSGAFRDDIAEEEGVIAFEMEGAGLWDVLHPIIIKGVSDYADSHKHQGWQKYAAITAAAGAKALLRSWTPSSLGVPSPCHESYRSSPQPSSVPLTPTLSSETLQPNVVGVRSSAWVVPFEHGEKLIGRSAELTRIQSSLFAPDSCSRTAIEGLGGIGKSRLALEIAYTTKFDHPNHSVFWIQCSTLSSFEQDCRRVAKVLGLTGAEDLSQDPKALVKRYLDRDDTSNWLLILDSADDETVWSAKAAATTSDALTKFIPRGRNGAVLITTRNHKVAIDIAPQTIVTLSQLHVSDSQLMLESLLGQSEMYKDKNASVQLLNHLAHLPLAIVQAAAFIKANNYSHVGQYLEHWNDDTEDDLIEVLSEEFTSDIQYRDVERTIAKTWLISFKNISVQYPVAAIILSYMACLNPKQMLKSAIPPLSMNTTRLERNQAFGTLQNYAFIQAQKTDSSDTVFNMHHLVHLVTRNYLRKSGEFSIQMQVVARHLCHLIPSGGLNLSVYWQKYLPHAEKVVSTRDIVDEVVRIELQELLSTAYFETGSYVKALAYRQDLVDWLSQSLSNDGRRVMRNTSALSEILCQLGRWQDAVVAAKSAVELSQQVLSANDPERVSLMQGLADAARCAGKCDEALRLSLKLVEVAKSCVFKSQEHKHATLMSALHSLSVAYHSLRLYQDQERVLLEAIDVAKSIKDQTQPTRKAEFEMALAAAYCRLGKADLAEKILLQMKQMLEVRLGRLHRLTLSCISGLADAYQAQERYIDAENLYRELLKMYVEAGRKEDFHVLRDRKNLAYAMMEQGKHIEAKELQLETIGMATAASGQDSVLTLFTLEELARCYWHLGRRMLAAGMMASCFNRSTHTLGLEHPDTRKRLEIAIAWRTIVGSQTSRKRPYHTLVGGH